MRLLWTGKEGVGRLSRERLILGLLLGGTSYVHGLVRFTFCQEE